MADIDDKKTKDQIDETSSEDETSVEDTTSDNAEVETSDSSDSNNENDKKDSDETSVEEVKEDESEKKEKESKEKKSKKDGVISINTTVPDEAKWYVVHTYSGHENKVATTLKQRIEAGGFIDRIFTLFIPQQQKIVVSEGKKRSVEERLFPGYLIVQMLLDDDSWYVVRSTPGVTGFVGMGTTPTPLPESEVKGLMRFAEMEAPKFETKFRVGDSVKIKEGPFKDFLGKVDEVNEDQGKAKVLVSVFGRETPVELDFEQIISL